MAAGTTAAAAAAAFSSALAGIWHYQLFIRFAMLLHHSCALALGTWHVANRSRSDLICVCLSARKPMTLNVLPRRLTRPRKKDQTMNIKK